MDSDNFFVFITSSLVICVSVLLISAPIVEWHSSGIVQKQLNTQCGTNYSQMEVFFSGEKLTELCKIRNQQITVKK
jgi:hypothetical protein